MAVLGIVFALKVQNLFFSKICGQKQALNALGLCFLAAILSQTYNATSVYFLYYTPERYQINFVTTELDCQTIDTSQNILVVTFCVMRLKKLIIFQR